MIASLRSLPPVLARWRRTSVSTVTGRRALAGSPYLFCSLVAIFAFFFAVDKAGAEGTQKQIPADLRAAISTTLQSHGMDYAGLCDNIDHSANHGRWCATVESLTDTSASVNVRQVGSSASHSVSYVKSGGTWTVSSHSLPQVVTNELRNAVRALAEGRGFQFSGFCSDFVPPSGAQLCANLVSISGGTAVISLGPVNAPNAYSAVFTFQSGQWYASSHTLPVSIPNELRVALKGFVEGRGYSYAGLCNEIDQARYTGLWCATVVSMNGGSALVSLGQLPSTTGYQATLVRDGAAWVVTAHNVPVNVPAGLRTALASLVSGRGHTYAGLCDEIDPTRYPGQWCATISYITPNAAGANLGPVLTGGYQATFARNGGTWTATNDNVPYSVSIFLRAALKSHIEGKGYTYAGLCGEIDPSRHAGEWCASPISLGANSSEFSAGQVGSGKTYRLALVRSGASWSVSSSAVPLNVPAELRARVKTLVESRGFNFAGLCAELEVGIPENWCANVEISGSTARVTAGPIPGGTLAQATFAVRGGTWTLDSHRLPLNMPDDLRAQIKGLINGRGLSFAGICEELSGSGNAGKACAAVTWLDGTHVSVKYGIVGGSQPYSATFAMRDGAWALSSGDVSPIVTPTKPSEPAPTTPKPNTPTPRPGTSTPVPQPGNTASPTPTTPGSPGDPGTPGTPGAPGNPGFPVDPVDPEPSDDGGGGLDAEDFFLFGFVGLLVSGLGAGALAARRRHE